jgi:hypothetical protein
MNPELCNFVLNDISNNNDTTSYGPNCLSLALPGQQQQQPISDDLYTSLILEDAEKLYNDLTIKLTNEIVIAATAAMKTLSLPLPLSSSNKNQKLNYENDTDQTEETRCNNQPQIYNGNQEQANER